MWGGLILQLVFWLVLAPNNKGHSVENLQALELFAFQSQFQRAKVRSDQSHMHYRYTGRSGFKGRGFNNNTFLRLAILLAEGTRDGVWHAEFTPRTQEFTWVYKRLMEDKTEGKLDHVRKEFSLSLSNLKETQNEESWQITEDKSGSQNYLPMRIILFLSNKHVI